MSESEDFADNIVNFSTGSQVQSDQNLKLVVANRNVIQDISQKLMDTDWRELKSNSTVLRTIEVQLRDTIKNLKQLSRDLAGTSVNIDGILSALLQALVELYKASDLSDTPDFQISSSRYDNLIKCWNYLNLAIALMFQQD